MNKDEQFLLELYKRTRRTNETLFDPESIGRALTYSPRQIENILRGLTKANLVKKFSDHEIAITPRGEEVAHELQ